MVATRPSTRRGLDLRLGNRALRWGGVGAPPLSSAGHLGWLGVRIRGQGLSTRDDS